MKRVEKGGAPRETSGYLTSAVAFSIITALWAVIVRDDPYYRLTDLFGMRIPAILLAYALFMPLIGFIVGRWRYHLPHRGRLPGLVLKSSARIIQFTYVHLLIVLFTVAMATDTFFGLNIDDQVRRVDDRLFDVAARFAPWLAAYLAGFNLGRASRKPEDPQLVQFDDSRSLDDGELFDHAAAEEPNLPAPPRSEPPVSGGFFEPSDHWAGKDNRPASEPSLTHSGLPRDLKRSNDEQPGFLPPQDFEQLRPRLKQLR